MKDLLIPDENTVIVPEVRLVFVEDDLPMSEKCQRCYMKNALCTRVKCMASERKDGKNGYFVEA